MCPKFRQGANKGTYTYKSEFGTATVTFDGNLFDATGKVDLADPTMMIIDGRRSLHRDPA
ncbi:hypothetical protein ACODT3_39725 [Streptomyces sp. 4.24]|uniref:hypothetical protein n=1 Tax=Streptomyces tritrimontium TaxID=3406573 RepID=UPI003BB6ACF6